MRPSDGVWQVLHRVSDCIMKGPESLALTADILEVSPEFRYLCLSQDPYLRDTLLFKITKL